MNAMEHGNQYDSEKPVAVDVSADGDRVRVAIRDQGGAAPIEAAPAPDLDAKLAGLQTPRGWGLFLIQNMVDSMEVDQDEHHHTITLVIHLATPDAVDGNGNKDGESA